MYLNRVSHRPTLVTHTISMLVTQALVVVHLVNTNEQHGNSALLKGTMQLVDIYKPDHTLLKH